MNFRGLILYLIGETYIEDTEGKVRNKRISKILSNLSNNYVTVFPFLAHYDDFRKVFEAISHLKQIRNYYEVELIKDIARELESQVYYARESFLSYWVTRKYSNEITRCFRLAYEWDNSFKSQDVSNDPFLKKFREYQLQSIQILIGILSRDLDDLTYKSDNLKMTLGSIDEYPAFQPERDVDFTLFEY